MAVLNGSGVEQMILACTIDIHRKYPFTGGLPTYYILKLDLTVDILFGKMVLLRFTIIEFINFAIGSNRKGIF